jgi:IS30 family transposase
LNRNHTQEFRYEKLYPKEAKESKEETVVCLNAGMTASDSAGQLERDKSVVSLEIRRNNARRRKVKHRAAQSQMRSDERKKAAIPGDACRIPRIRAYVGGKLKNVRWTPEMTAGRPLFGHPDLRVRCEAITGAGEREKRG